MKMQNIVDEKIWQNEKTGQDCQSASWVWSVEAGSWLSAKDEKLTRLIIQVTFFRVSLAENAENFLYSCCLKFKS